MTLMVELVIDEQAMRRTLRYAFANHDTAVQELIQNARRAGATQVEISYNADTLELVVADDGHGIDDFAVLMRAGGSGWNQAVAAEEKPYGLGFLSAIYAADHVTVASRGKCLAFNTEEAIEQGSFAVVDAPTGAGTTIRLRGFKWTNPTKAARHMARGYPLPIVLNGEALTRPEAVTKDWADTPVGRIKLLADSYASEDSVRVYLQGFLVKDSPRAAPGVLVHLDSKRFLGKLPDRNVVIDEAAMVAAVQLEVRSLYEKRLEDMRATLEPAAFCEQAYGLARSLKRLDVFNTIDVAPRSWLSNIASMPHEAFSWASFLADMAEGPPVTRAEVERGEWRICDLLPFNAGLNEHERQWLFAWKAGYLQLDQKLHDEHWLVKLATVTDLTEVDLRVDGPGARGHTPSRTTVVCAAIQVCEGLELTANGTTVRVDEAMADLDEDGNATIYVMRNGDDYAAPTRETLLQIASYRGDFDDELDGDADADADIVCSAVREMVAKTPEERVALAIGAAIRDYELRGLRCRIEIDAQRRVTVTELTFQSAAQ